MSFEVLSKDGLVRQVKFTYDVNKFNAEYKSQVNHLVASKSFKLQGFRPGKVPFNIAEPYFRQEATAEVLRKFEAKSFEEYTEQTKETTLIVFNRDIKWVDDGSKLENIVSFEVTPEIAIKDLSEVSVDYPVVDEDKAVEEMILALRTQRSTYELADKAAEVDDLVEFTATTTDENGIEFAPFTGDISLVVGSYQYPSEFSGEFVGRKAGDEFETKLSFTEAKEYTVKVKVNAVKLRHLGEVDQKFIKEFLNSDKATLEDLKAEIKKNLDREIRANTYNYFLKRVHEKLIELYSDVTLPEHVLEFYVYRRFEAYVINSSKGKNLTRDQIVELTLQEVNKEESTKEIITNEERENLLVELVQSRYIQEYGISVSKEDLDEYIAEVSIMFEQPEQYRREAYNNQNFLQAARAEIVAQKIAQLYKSLVKVNEVPFGYTDLVRYNKGNSL
ncbi:trigger factor [Psittacicella melopsittaci]|uniref:Trigger factor n=1 Tax=Psittacicella melopsittaci TaxID=2028576 RepID=A0A3A1Y761_9GAMM|nr:trigger factor [Psittacicella melopsittaci]RIY33058.1 trigger factor [Psittacicella melopsittaci]